MSHRALAVVRRGLLPFVAVALVAGAVASIVGADDVAVAVWSVASGVVAVELVVVTITRLREGRIAVDVVALVALLGAILMGEALAGVILALMVASGDALEQYRASSGEAIVVGAAVAGAEGRSSVGGRFVRDRSGRPDRPGGGPAGQAW